MKFEWAAADILRNLNGFLCVYKPRDLSLTALKKHIIKRICLHGNSLEFPRVPMKDRPIVEPHERTGAPVVVGVRHQMDYTQHPLVNGMPFNEMDFLLEELEPMEATTSGVVLFGLNTSEEEIESVRDLVWTNEYNLSGKLGEASVGNELKGKIAAKAKADHITKIQIRKLLTRLLFHYKRLSFELANVDMSSEEAFDLARKGAARPKIIGSPVIYYLNLSKFEYPNFYLRLSSVSENCNFLRSFVHEIGCSLGSLARPTKVHRIRIGPFLRQHALLESQFQLVNILKNIKMCNQIIDAEKKVKKSHTIEIMPMDQSTSYINLFNLDEEKRNIERFRAINDGIEDNDDLKIPWGRDYN